jgi:hypothetical protein
MLLFHSPTLMGWVALQAAASVAQTTYETIPEPFTGYTKTPFLYPITTTTVTRIDMFPSILVVATVTTTSPPVTVWERMPCTKTYHLTEGTSEWFMVSKREISNITSANLPSTAVPTWTDTLYSFVYLPQPTAKTYVATECSKSIVVYSTPVASTTITRTSFSPVNWHVSTIWRICSYDTTRPIESFLFPSDADGTIFTTTMPFTQQETVWVTSPRTESTTLYAFECINPTTSVVSEATATVTNYSYANANATILLNCRTTTSYPPITSRWGIGGPRGPPPPKFPWDPALPLWYELTTVIPSSIVTSAESTPTWIWTQVTTTYVTITPKLTLTYTYSRTECKQPVMTAAPTIDA